MQVLWIHVHGQRPDLLMWMQLGSSFDSIRGVGCFGCLLPAVRPCLAVSMLSSSEGGFIGSRSPGLKLLVLRAFGCWGGNVGAAKLPMWVVPPCVGGAVLGTTAGPNSAVGCDAEKRGPEAAQR